MCFRCAATLERASGRNLTYGLALALGTLLLLFPANLMTLLSVSVAGVDRSSRLGSGVAGMWAQGWPLLAIVVGLQGVVLPFFRFGVLVAALAAIRFHRADDATGMLFRWAEELDRWAMPDVFLIGAAVGYSRVAVHLDTRIGPGGWCLIGAAVLAMLTRATLDRRAIWQAILASGATHSSVRGAVSESRPDHPLLACTSCDLVVPSASEGARCPRCRAALHHRQPFSLTRTMALISAGYLLYPAANYFPMSIDIQFGEAKNHTIVSGIEQLVAAGGWPIAVLIFTTSIAIPLLKLVGLTWLVWSVKRGSGRRLRVKTRLYRVIGEIGRWSNVDVFTIAIFLPLMQFDGLVSVRAATGAPAFLAVVVLTMLAVRCFDPRLIWDSGRT
ncbi:MAG TPA: paraquat-inducible protein A [Acetobacteraceae bacterium]|jgi:paraquat-inducible protein A